MNEWIDIVLDMRKSMCNKCQLHAPRSYNSAHLHTSLAAFILVVWLSSFVWHIVINEDFLRNLDLFKVFPLIDSINL